MLEGALPEVYHEMIQWMILSQNIDDEKILLFFLFVATRFPI
jgi:hypothetical protein